MSFAEALRDDVSVEECLDELSTALAAFAHVPPTLLAVALRVHLEALLQALLDARLCSQAEVRAFVRELERETLEYGED
jgi:hypothetical protein